MKKIIVALAILLCTVAGRAQVSYDTVTATVLDPNGHPYANAQWSATLVNSVGNQVYSATTPNGQIYNAAAAPPQGTIQANGLLSMQLVPNNILITPPGTQWLISITFPADREILTYNPPWTINYTIPITAPIDLSSQISALAQQIEFINLRTGQNTLNPEVSGVTQLIPQAGGNCTVSPSNGTGVVTFNCTAPASGFPIHIGSTAIAANETVSELDTLIVNGVNLKTDGPATQYLDRTGNYSVPPGGTGCPLGTCVQNNAPSNDQTVVEGAGHNLNVNNFEGFVYGDQYGSGSNGIETAYAQCLAQNGLGFSGCSILVSPNYTNADAPNGWSFNSSYYANIPMQIPSGGAVYDSRNGTQYWQFHNPLNPITGQGTGLAIITQFDINTADSNAVVGGPNRTGIYNLVNVLNGGSEFNYYPSGLPQYLGETYTYGTYDVLNNYIGGINFLHYGYENCRSNGDCYLRWEELTADGGVLSGNSEGAAAADIGVREDPDVFTGTVTGSPSTGATQIHVSPTIGGGSQGAMYRWLVNQSSPIATGTQFTGTISELTTGSAGNSAIMPPAVIDSTQNFPVSTMVQICYPGADNGATAATITQWVINSNVATFTTNTQTPALAAGQQLLLTNFAGGGGAIFDGQFVTVLSAGLSSTQFSVNFTHSNIALQISLGTATGGPAGCQSGSQPVGYIPSQNYRFTVTGGSVTSGVGTFAIAPTAPQGAPVQLVAGQVVMLYGFALGGNGAFLNQQSVTVLSSGLSANQFEANVTGPNTASIGAGYSTGSLTGYNPAQAVPVQIVPTYSTGGGTGGLPAGFCTPSTVQTTNSSAACYLPTSGVGCVADQVEIEPVNYTYSTGTGLITLNTLQFPHLNGAIFSVGGLACKNIEDVSSQYTQGGTNGVLDEVYPTAGSLNATTVYYVPQRTNLGYASPPLGGSTDGGSANGGYNASQQTALCFSATMTNFALNSGVVSFSMGGVAGTSGGEYPNYNNKTVTLAANGDASYNGTYAITVVSGNNFQYTPTAPTGTMPTSGTVSFCNANYKILDAARVFSVLNPSNNAVDDTFVLFPNTFNGSADPTVREPHYQRIDINGTHQTETQYQPKVWNGGPTDNLSYYGNISGPGWGLEVTNNASGSMYLGGGGTLSPPTSPLSLLGTWLDTLFVSAPQQAIIAVNNWNLAGPSSSLSTFGLIQFPQLPGAFAGYGIDTLCYNPFYNYANRGNALTGGEYIFGNTVGAGCGGGVANGNLVSTVRYGHGIIDLDLSVPEITTKDVTVTQLSNFVGNAPSVVGNQTGSTCYDYQIVAHDKNNGSTVPPGIIGPGPCSVNNGQATLNGTNFNRICAFLNPGVYSYDFLKLVGGTYQSMATNVAVGNGASHSQVPNYTCWDDQGGSTSTYPYPTQNTTGSISSSTVVASTSVSSPMYTMNGLTLKASAFVPDVTVNVPVLTVPANSCWGSALSTPASVSMPGLAAGMGVMPMYTSNAAAIAGWGTSGGLNFQSWYSASGTFLWQVCNPTGSPVGPTGAITFQEAAE